jgi:4'-phosphopantetheinyl transferase
LNISWLSGTLPELVCALDDICVWQIDLADPHISNAAQSVALSADDLANFATGAERGTRLVRRRLTKLFLACRAGIRADEVRIQRMDGCAPSVIMPQEWFISVAGRGTQHVITTARMPIGVDYEPFSADPPLWDMMTANERAAIECLPALAQPHAWLRRWVAKEAHCKRLGTARIADPACIDTQAQGAHLIAHCAQGHSHCHIKEAGGAYIALASAFDAASVHS